MTSAGEWVRHILDKTQSEPMATEDVLKSLERHVGQGEKALARLKDVLHHIDEQLIDHKGGHAMRELWATVTDYLEKVQEGLAAA